MRLYMQAELTYACRSTAVLIRKPVPDYTATNNMASCLLLSKYAAPARSHNFLSDGTVYRSHAI